MKYLFETKEFGICKESFHLLRSRFNYKTYNVEDIDDIVIKNGKQINNWMIILAIGIAMISFSIYYTYNLFIYMSSEEARRIYIEQIIVPVIPFLIGLYCVYSSLKVGPVINLHLKNNTRKSFPLAQVRKNNQMELLTSTLKQSTEFGNKLSVKV